MDDRAAFADVVPGNRSPRAAPVGATRSKVTNDPFVSARGSSRAAQDRRRRDLVALFIEGLGGRAAVSELTHVAIRKAAELTVAAEMARANVLNGATTVTDLEVLIKLEGEARRAVRALGLKTNAKPATLSDLLRRSPP
jgi:hypothetical protein